MLRLTCSESPNSSTAFKNQGKLLTSGVIFGVSKYECFTENKNIIRKFFGFKLQKKVFEPIQKYVLIKSVDALGELQDNRIPGGKKVNKL